MWVQWLFLSRIALLSLQYLLYNNLWRCSRFFWIPLYQQFISAFLILLLLIIGFIRWWVVWRLRFFFHIEIVKQNARCDSFTLWITSIIVNIHKHVFLEDLRHVHSWLLMDFFFFFRFRPIIKRVNGVTFSLIYNDILLWFQFLQK